jgi:serine phosphatase RsbU (regulator of sigma subunit)
VRPQLSDGSTPGRAARARGVRGWLLATWPRRILTAALALVVVELLLAAFGRALPNPLWITVKIVLALYLLWLPWRALRWLADRFLWRIRTKLILSYLFIALVPVVLLAVFFVTAGVLILLLSGSRLVTLEVDRIADVARATATSAIGGLPAADDAAARTLEQRLAPIRSLHPAASWTLLRRGRVAAAHGEAPRELPSWWKGEPFVGLLRVAGQRGLGRAVLRVAVGSGEDVLLLDVPADAQFFADLERRAAIHVLSPEDLQLRPRREHRGGVHVSGRPQVEYEDNGQRVAAPSGPGLGFIALPPLQDWASGGRSNDQFFPLVFRFQPLEFVRRLSPQMPHGMGELTSLADMLIVALGILAGVFLVMYAFALALGLMLARSITYGVHALSVGTQRLRQGDFDHLIAVRSRDQLGDLAASFNQMSLGLKQLMAEQAERQRLEEELRIARQIQMSLLPGQDMARMSGLRIAALCLPAAEVGGDYYDLLPLSPTRMGVLIADVSGKGTSAALYMAELKGLVLSLSRIHDSPARLLVEANRILAANMDSRSFVTMTYAIVDTASRCMRFARAGHNPVLQLQAGSGRSRVLAPPGLGLGLDGGERFERILEEQEVPLHPGDLFLFFTDGLSEAMNAGSELFGEGRLSRILEDGAALGSEELKEKILDEVRRFVGDAAQHDDMTLVVLKVVQEDLV